MPRSKDKGVEARAVGLAQADHLEWVKRPRREGQPDTPAAATNAERDGYRRQARAEMDSEQPKDGSTS